METSTNNNNLHNLTDILLLLEKITPEFNWQISLKPELAELTSNISFSKAKELQKSPVEIAKDYVPYLTDIFEANNIFVKVTAVGAYINLQLTDEFWKNYILSNREIKIEKNGKKLILEFVSPNIAKPLHAGHILQGNFGQVLKNVFKLKYKEVITDSHWADQGVALGKVLWGWKQIGDSTVVVKIMDKETEIKLSNYHIDPVGTLYKVYVWSNTQSHLPHYDQGIRDETLKFEQGDNENRRLCAMFLKDSQADANVILDRINIDRFDYEIPESAYENEVKELSEFMDENKLWSVEEKGRYIQIEDLANSWEGIDEKTRKQLKQNGRCYLIQSKDGYSTYALRDVATRIQYAKDFKADKMITMAGNEQIHHFEQFISINNWLSQNKLFIEKYGQAVASRLTTGAIESIHNGFLTLAGGKMSGRTGYALTAKDLLDEVENTALENLVSKNESTGIEELKQKAKVLSVSAIKWFNLNRDISQDVVCDIPSILNFVGNTGVYQLYTIARLNSILKKQGHDVANQGLNNKIDWDLLNDEEKAIIKKTVFLENILLKISTEYKPHYLTNHLFDVASSINSWYTKYSVTSETNKVRKQSMVLLCKWLVNYQKMVLGVLNIQTLESI